MATKLGFSRLTLFALPALVSAITHGPIAGIIPALYSEKFALDLAVIGGVLLLARAFDAITDPLIGYMSDRTESRWGRRKPWMVAGTIITVIAMYFLFTPGESSSMAYLLIFSLLLYLGWTVLEIPYASWVLELSRDTKERTKIFSYRAFFTFVGGLLFTLMPQFVPAAEGQMTFQVLGILAMIMAVAVPLTTLLAVKFVPQGDVVRNTDKPKLSELWGSVKRNKPFKFFVVAYLFIGLASGISGVLSFLYVDNYLGIGDKFSQLFAPAIIIGPIMIPIWMWVLNRTGKYKVTTIAFFIYALLMPIPWFVPPGPDSFMPMLIYFCATTAFMPLLMITMPAILGDIIDYDEVQTRKNRSGQYYAFLALITKATAAIGGPIALLIVGLAGYAPSAEENSEAAILGLRVVYNLLPAILVFPAVYLLWKFPITDKSQPELMKELEGRVEQEAKLAMEDTVSPAQGIGT